jgi:hypothetical protein
VGRSRKEVRLRGVSVMRDKELTLEDVETSYTLCGSGQGGPRRGKWRGDEIFLEWEG